MSHRQLHPNMSHLDKEPLPSQMRSSMTAHSSHHKLPGSEHTKDEAGVCEAYSGIIESTDIDPLHHEQIKGEQSGASKVPGGPAPSSGPLASAANVAAGAAKYLYSAAVGDEAGKRAGKESMSGSN